MTIDKKIPDLIRDVPNFPKEGIIFKDITPLLADGAAFKAVIEEFAALCKGKGITKVVAIEARGFIFGAPLACALGVGFVPVRKKGKLPFETISADYALEYGAASVEMHKDALAAGDKVIIIDDLLATGGTMAAAIKLSRQLGAQVELAAFLLELKFLNGREKVDAPVTAFIEI
ncbi:MAG: adenine phosphoribosyltransferase [Elusimicrobiota bacterium]|jgi:adenine phosphoribosyltransferase|nr:adenine phosphoribosyltransferase [Elusimicrobiota bacterium]